MKPKSITLTLAGCAVLAAAVLLPRESAGQAGGEDVQVQQLLVDLLAQQAKITENQTQIDAKTDAVAEEIRLARIYAGRAGGKTK